MKLPVTVPLHDAEPATSLASRLAYANEFDSLREFLHITGHSVQAISTGEPKAIAALSEWSGVPEDRIGRFTVTTLSKSSTWALGTSVMSKEMRAGLNHRYCRVCVMSDLENGTGPLMTRPYVRASWLTRALQNCPEHGSPILEAPMDPLNKGDFTRFVAENLESIRCESTGARQVATCEADRYVQDRIEGGRPGGFLGDFEMSVAVDLCRYVGRLHRQHHPEGVSDTEKVSEVELGYGLVRGGLENVEAMVAEAAARLRPISLEIPTLFGELREWLARNKKKREFNKLVEIFQDMAERNMPIGPDENFILPTRRRRIHTVRSASLQYDVLEERVYQLMLNDGVIEETSLPPSRIYLNAERADAVLSAAVDTMTSVEIAAALGTNTDVVRRILNVGLLQSVETREEGARAFTRVRRTDFEKFVSSLDAPLVYTYTDAELTPLQKAAQKCACKVEEILKHILSGDIRTFRYAHGKGVVTGLLVDIHQAKSLCSRLSQHGSGGRRWMDAGRILEASESPLSRKQAAAKLATAPGNVDELELHGHLTRVQFTDTSGFSHGSYFTESSIAEFLNEHVSVFELRKLTGRHPSFIQQELDRENIAPIYKPTKGRSTFYRRGEVSGFLKRHRK